ncbi:MAG: type II secretion system GspH family protein [Hylemonella sp.]|nr:type II secretion system GspH family protein [Hylemonella sp.]MDH5709388.1 type II secretion system GspH family protein [Hylemonella sp.]
MRARGFTLLELLFVLVIVALLSSLVAPMLVGSIDQARESALKQDLHVMRQALDDYHADHGKYPAELAELVQRRYLRAIPVDPITQRSDSWTPVYAGGDSGARAIIDVHSGAAQAARDGSQYRDW